MSAGHGGYQWGGGRKRAGPSVVELLCCLPWPPGPAPDSREAPRPTSATGRGPSADAGVSPKLQSVGCCPFATQAAESCQSPAEGAPAVAGQDGRWGADLAGEQASPGCRRARAADAVRLSCVPRGGSPCLIVAPLPPQSNCTAKEPQRSFSPCGKIHVSSPQPVCARGRSRCTSKYLVESK